MTAGPGRYGIEDTFTRGWLRPAFWTTLARLVATARPEVAHEGRALRFTRYPFEPATVFPTGTLEADGIAEVNLGWPSRVRLTSGDIVFVPGPGKEALVTFINENDVRVERRVSVWSALLAPFLDTWEDQATIDGQFAWFAGLGLDRDAVDRWRREVAVAMLAYNFGTGLWEWAHLDLYDLLVAQRARLTRRAFADFYARAIRLAAIDPVSPGSSPFGNDVANALFAVLIDWYPSQKGRRGAAGTERLERIERIRQPLVAELTAAYSEPHRRYHTLAHIEHCLAELGRVWSYAIHLNEIRWALLFHDAIYDPQRRDNEARAADWACRVMGELGRPEDERTRVGAMILATAHAGEPRTPDEALLLDVDLSILGADEAAFDAYDRAIREEYGWVPEEHYRLARAGVLESFARRERLYHTAPYRRRCEAAARRNIERALGRLRAP